MNMEILHEQTAAATLGTDILGLVPEERKSAFLKFVETGEADDDFLNYLNGDERCRRAVEMAFTKQAQGFQELAEALKEPPIDIEPLGEGTVIAPRQTVRDIVANLEVALRAAAANQDRMLDRSTARIAAATKGEDVGIITKVVRSLEDNLAKIDRA